MEVLTITDRNELYGLNAKYKGYNMFIEAGAGAGKTETLINLIVDQLYNGVSPDRIVAITFTNKATEELISRISSGLDQRLLELKKVSGDKVRIEILENALSNIYKMNVSTIHSFCNVILNENSYKAKLSYAFSLFEEDDEEKRRNKFYYKWYRENIKDIKIDYDDIKEIKKTYDALCEQFDDIGVNSDIKLDYDLFLDRVIDLYNEVSNYKGAKYLSKAANNFINGYEQVINNIGKLSNKDLFDQYITADMLALINRNIKLNKNSSIDYASINKNIIEPLVENLCEINDIAKKFIETTKYNAINKLAKAAWDSYKENRDRESLCNNQLIYETYKLIRDNEDVKEKLANKYDVIFVDEFQDTDKYQNQFIMELALAIDERKQEKSTSLVLVGDPKQSIYGFRGADFELFMDTKDKFGNCGLKNAINIFFPDNYRSNEYILKWVNDTYSNKVFYPNYDYIDMTLPSKNKLPNTIDKKTLAGVYSYNFNSGDKFNNLAHFIKKLKEDKYKLYSRKSDKEEYAARDIEYQDILVLTSSHSEINEYVVAFNNSGIKALVTGAFDLTSSMAFNYIYRILMYVLDEQDNNNELFADQKVKMEKIDEETKNLSAYGKLAYVFNNIDLILDNFSSNDVNLLKTILMQVLENVCYSKDVSSIELLDEVDELIHKVAKAQLSLSKNEDAVRIMNVHNAKGLTSEIVIFVDSGSFSSEKNKCKVLKNTIYLNNFELFSKESELYNENKESEKLRLEYVAATRARQTMIFESDIKSDHMFNRKSDPYELKVIDNKYNNGTMLPDIGMENLDNVSVGTKSIRMDGLTKIDCSLLDVEYSEITPSSLEKNSKTKEKENKTKYNRPANNIFGTLFHRVMELFILKQDSNIDDVIKAALNEKDIDDEEYEKYLKECANATIKLFKDNKLLEDYSTLLPEFKFYDYDDSIYGRKPTVINGSIDLMFIKDNKEVIVVDYKTDTNQYSDNIEFEKVLKDKYGMQLEAYKNVVSKYANVDIKKVDARIVYLEEKDNNTVAHFVNI